MNGKHTLVGVGLSVVAVVGLVTALELNGDSTSVTASRTGTTTSMVEVPPSATFTTTTAVPTTATTTTTPPPSTVTAPSTGVLPPTGSTALPPPGTTPGTTAGPGAGEPPDLRSGSHGPAVVALEQRLDDLGYWLGAPDDDFDDSTSHAVVAFQKLHGLTPDGIAGDITMEALAIAGRATPRSRTSHVLEIDLTHQVLVVADEGAVTFLLDVSTGRVAGTTPVGRYSVTREIDGYRRSPLGVLYRPKYIVGGVAVHGYPSVPPFPASHGCVRTTNEAMDWLWQSQMMPVGASVWVYR